MTFPAADFLEFARRLSNAPNVPGPDEAALRTAASRAYYAAFHEALARACREGYQATYSGVDHERVRAHYRESAPPSPARRRVSTQLGRLIDLRKMADYEPLLDRTASSLASHAISMANIIITDLQGL